MDRILQALAKGPRSSLALMKETQLARVVMHKKLNLLREQKRLLTTRFGRHAVYELKGDA